MKNALITLIVLFFGAITSTANEELGFIIEPGASLSPRNIPYPTPTQEVIEGAEKQFALSEDQLRQGITDQDSVYTVHLKLLHLQLAAEGVKEKDRLATYSNISKVTAERAKLVKARHKQGMASTADMLTTKAQAAWARANLSYSADNTAYEQNLVIAHTALTALVKEYEKGYRQGLVGYEAGLLAEIALGEVEVLQLYWKKNRHTAAKRTQANYDKLVKLCDNRAKNAPQTRKHAAHARIAAATFARECALHLSKDPAATRRAQKQLCTALGSLQQLCTQDYGAGLCTMTELNAVSARLAAEWQKLQSLSNK